MVTFLKPFTADSLGKKWEIQNYIGFVGTIQVEFLVRVKFNVLINLELKHIFLVEQSTSYFMILCRSPFTYSVASKIYCQ